MSQKTRRYTDQEKMAERRQGDIVALEVGQKELMRRCDEKEEKVEQLQIELSGLKVQVKEMARRLQQVDEDLKVVELKIAAKERPYTMQASAKVMPSAKTIASSIGLIIVTIAGAIQALKEYLTQ